MKLVKKNNCGVIIGEIARGVLGTVVIGTLVISLNISCNTKNIKPHVKLKDTDGQIIYCVDKNDEIFIETLGYDVHQNSIVISDYLTGRVIAVTSKTAIEQYKTKNNLNNISEEELQKLYLSSILRKECVEIQSISSYVENIEERELTEFKLRKIINNIDEEPENYIEEENLKVMTKIKESD